MAKKNTFVTLLGSSKNYTNYFRDDFTADVAAGSVNLSLGSDGKTVRHVIDPNSHLSVTTTSLTSSGSLGSGATDMLPGLWYEAVPRVGYKGHGMVMIAKITPSVSRGPDFFGYYIDHSPTGAGPIGADFTVRFVSAKVFSSVLNTPTQRSADTFSAGTIYYVAVVAKPTSNELWIKGGEWATWTLIASDTTRTTPNIYPTSSYYMPTSATSSTIDYLILTDYVDNNFDRYINAGQYSFTSKNILIFGDSKSLSSSSAVSQNGIPSCGNTNSFRMLEVPLRIATTGATVATRAGTIADDLAAVVGGVPDYVCWNLGANDVAAMTDETTFKANAQTIIDAIHAKWASAKIYFMQVWRRNELTDCNTINGWYADLVTANAGVCFLGPDERIFLENGDDGATYTWDGVHPTIPGYKIEWQQWRTVLGG